MSDSIHGRDAVKIWSTPSHEVWKDDINGYNFWLIFDRKTCLYVKNEEGENMCIDSESAAIAMAEQLTDDKIFEEIVLTN